jgi:hypothetical protein
VVDSMFEPFTKIVVHPACASGVVKKLIALIHHGGDHGDLSGRMSDNNAVRKEVR